MKHWEANHRNQLDQTGFITNILHNPHKLERKECRTVLHYKTETRKDGQISATKR